MLKRILAMLLIAACMIPAMAVAAKYNATQVYFNEIETNGIIFKEGDRFTGARGISVELDYVDANDNFVRRGNNTVITVTIDGERVSEWCLTQRSGAYIQVDNMIYQASFAFTMKPAYAVPDSEGYLNLQGKAYRLCSENALDKKVKFVGTVSETMDDLFVVVIEENAAVAIKAGQDLAAEDRVMCKGTITDYYDYNGNPIPVITCDEVKLKLYDPLKKGDRGEDVVKMKQRLQELGYFRAGAELTDAYNDTCAERIKEFQQNNGMTGTGMADEETLALLYSDGAVGK